MYTTYLSNMKHLSEDCIKIIITRYPPKWIELSEPIKQGKNQYKVTNLDNTWLDLSLSPSEDILNKYKQDNNWGDYTRSFNKMMYVDDNMVDRMNKTAEASKKRDIALVCYEKENLRCHRSLLAKEIAKQHNLGYEEFKVNYIRMVQSHNGDLSSGIILQDKEFEDLYQLENYLRTISFEYKNISIPCNIGSKSEFDWNIVYDMIINIFDNHKVIIYNYK